MYIAEGSPGLLIHNTEQESPWPLHDSYAYYIYKTTRQNRIENTNLALNILWNKYMPFWYSPPIICLQREHRLNSLTHSQRKIIHFSNTFYQCCGSGPFFESGSADPGDPKKTGSGSYLDMFLMFSRINNFLWYLYTKSNHLMTLQIKDKNNFDETVF